MRWKQEAQVKIEDLSDFNSDHFMIKWETGPEDKSGRKTTQPLLGGVDQAG